MTKRHEIPSKLPSIGMTLYKSFHRYCSVKESVTYYEIGLGLTKITRYSVIV